jgi:ubiquinone/menaquinone biosynthesis C-methylase UbiE
MAIGHTAQTLPTYEAATFDLVYIDAGHFYPDVKADAQEAARIVKPDGTLIFNDYTLADHLANHVWSRARRERACRVDRLEGGRLRAQLLDVLRHRASKGLEAREVRRS